jgi:hypothetical protein
VVELRTLPAPAGPMIMAPNLLMAKSCRAVVGELEWFLAGLAALVPEGLERALLPGGCIVVGSRWYDAMTWDNFFLELHCMILAPAAHSLSPICGSWRWRLAPSAGGGWAGFIHGWLMR